MVGGFLRGKRFFRQHISFYGSFRKEAQARDGNSARQLRVAVARETLSDRRARKNAADRQKPGKSAKGKIGADVLIGDRGTKKYLKLAEGQTPNSYVPDEEKIASDACWDGLRGVLTDLPLASPEEIREVLNHRRSIWRIEESFRISKSDLRIHPVYHWTKVRIEAHILLCYLVYACARYIFWATAKSLTPGAR